MENIVNYGIHKNYLNHWVIEHALREIMQNFMDYGEYKVKTKIIGDNVEVVISNDYNPADLSFLAIGLSIKEGNEARGKYGEGLKMAMLVFSRLDKSISIRFKDKLIIPTFRETAIGKTFCIKIKETKLVDNFNIKFVVSKLLWQTFYSDIIKKEDIIFENIYGRIVDKPIGNIYCGGLFVINASNLSKSYDINPSYLSLDRDRLTPSTFNINWYTSKLNDAYGKINVRDLTYSDTEYLEKLPIAVKRAIKPVIVGNSIEYSYKNKGKTVLIEDSNRKALLANDSFFSKIVKRLKLYIVKQLGVYELLLEFKAKYVHSPAAIQDFDIILDRIQK